MTVDLSKIQLGDGLTLSFTGVVDHFGGFITLRNDAGFAASFSRDILEASVLTHTPKLFEAGDRVCKGRGEGGGFGTVLFADVRDVVVRWDEGGIHSGPADGWGATLRRAP